MNYSRIIARKLILGITALSLTIVCLVSTTFAWFAKNQNAWTKDFEMDLKGVEGLQLSLDGENFSQDILASDLKAYLLKDANKKMTELGKQKYESFDQIKFGFSTIKQQDGKIVKDANNQIKFTYDEVKGTLDQDDNPIYEHVMTDSIANIDKGYIKFDLYVKSTAPYGDRRTYKFNMTNGTKIISYLENTDGEKTSLADVKLVNKLTTREYDNVNNKYLDTYKQYNSGDIVKVDVANAVRLGIYNVYQDEGGKFTNYDKFRIFENSNENDLGSACIKDKDETDPTHYSLYNSMFTYYNNYFVKYPLQAPEDGEAFNTNLITYDDGGTVLPDNDSAMFGTFNYDPAKTEYNQIKLEMYIWLEGWDADYFVGIPNDVTIRVDLEFGIDMVQ